MTSIIMKIPPSAGVTKLTHRLPYRIYPYYLLVKLYAEHPDVFPKEKLEWAARMVMEKEPKVESTAIREMREEVKRIMDSENRF